MFLLKRKNRPRISPTHPNGRFSKKMKNRILLAGLIAALALSAYSRADVVVMDQIGSNPAFFTGASAPASQQFEPSNSVFNIGVIDNFTAPSAFTITTVNAAILGFNGFTQANYANITGYYVSIYSSTAAAAVSLTGDIGQAFVSPGSATLTRPFSGDAASALVSLSLSIPLPSSGTFWIGVRPEVPFTGNGQTGIYVTTGGPGFTPGGANAMQANPGSGWGFGPSGLRAVAPPGDAAYFVSGTVFSVPEPATFTLVTAAATLGLVVVRLRRRKA